MQKELAVIKGTPEQFADAVATLTAEMIIAGKLDVNEGFTVTRKELPQAVFLNLSTKNVLGYVAIRSLPGNKSRVEMGALDSVWSELQRLWKVFIPELESLGFATVRKGRYRLTDDVIEYRR